MFHQAAQGAGPAGQGSLLDHRPRPGVHVRGGILQETTQGLQEEGHEAVPQQRGVLQPGVQHVGAPWSRRSSSETRNTLRARVSCSHQLTVR